jgi:hypothetical protein
VVIATGVIELNLQTRSSRPSSPLALQWFRIATSRKKEAMVGPVPGFLFV